MTVSLLVVSHSGKIAEGAAELAAQMAPDVGILTAGGTDDGRIGTSLEKVLAALEDALATSNSSGVVVLADLGSAVMTAESGVEFSSSPDHILLADAPLVEGLVAAAVAAQGGAEREAVKAAAEAVRFGTPGQGVPEAPLPAAKAAEPSAVGEFELINPMGMHARPAAKIAGGLASLDAEVSVNGVEGTSIMALMTLAVGQGGKLRVEAWGKDADKAVRYVEGLVAKGFGEL